MGDVQVSAFRHCHAHSTYSYLDGYGTPEQIAERVKELGHDCCAVTDHGNIHAHVPYQKAFRKAGLRPVFGCEFYVVDKMDERTKHNESLGADAAPHVTVLAATQRGYENLVKLHNMSYSDGFYYKPRVDWAAIERHQEGLVVLSGCVGGYPSRLLRGKGAEAAWRFVAERAQRIERYFVELTPNPGLDISVTATPALMAIARDLRIPMVATADAHFPRREDHQVEDLMLCIGVGRTVADKSRTLKLPDYLYYCTDDELMSRASQSMWEFDALATNGGARIDFPIPSQDEYFAEFRRAMDNAGAVLGMCDAEIGKAKPVTFHGRARDEDPAGVLWRWVVEGVARRKAQGLIPPEREREYYDRAAHEFAVISRKGFCDYVLATVDVIRWCKEQGGLVTCRGSAGGCLLLWLTGASHTDSVRHELSFERFYDDTRPDPPDIDVDFEKAMRPRVVQYVYEKYGAENCSQIAAVGLLRAKNALLDAAKAFGIDAAEVAPLAALLDSKDDDVDKQVDGIADPAAVAVLKKYPQLHIIGRMVGQARQPGIHACGIIVSSEPLEGVMGVTMRGDMPVSTVDKHGAADLGLLKMDLLSVAGLDVIGRALRLAGLSPEVLEVLPMGDAWDRAAGFTGHEPIYAMAIAGAAAGVFQLDGVALQVARQIGMTTFEELYAASALCRPGAADFVPLYVQNKYDSAAFESYLAQCHPVAAETVRKTNGVLLYQEQVMRLCRELAGMPWPKVHALRKRIAAASFNGHELGAEYSEPFIAGCVANGVSEAEALRWWDAIKAHGIYSFNKSHCLAYGVIGYWMLWLKAHHPDAYYEAFLSVEGEKSTPNDLLIKRLIAEFKARGGRMLALDPRESRATFRAAAPGVIVGGYSNIKGVGEKGAAALAKYAPYGSWEELGAAMRGNRLGSVFEKLRESGLTGELPIDTQAAVELAPWLPVAVTHPEDAAKRDHWRLARPGQLVGDESSSGNLLVGGYVTARHKKHRTGSFKGDQIIWMLEDDTGGVPLRVPKRQIATLGVEAQRIRVGDYLATEAWWSGDTLYMRKFVVLSSRGKGALAHGG